MEHRQLVIIGAGAAGLTAAIYGRRAGLDTLVLERGLYGGMINSTAEVENYPGTKRVTGMALAAAFREQAESFGPEFRSCGVQRVVLRGGRDGKVVVTDAGEISADALIIASGAEFSKVGCEGEEKFLGKGVSYCAVCDGAFYDGAPVAVIGGGNAAVEEAEYLTQFASRVYIIHRREEFRADASIVERVLSNTKIEPVLGCVVDEIYGGDMVEGVRVTRLGTGEKKRILTEGVFIFVGIKPTADFLEGSPIERSKSGWIITDDKMETSIDGVFAAGDIREKFLRQVVTAAGDGAAAAMAAYEYISNLKYFEDALFGHPHAYALLTSSIVPEHISLARDAEDWKKSSHAHIVFIDAHRSRRVMDELGVSELPSLVELKDGVTVRVAGASSLDDVINFVREVAP
ncbi:MAG: FAD-dependent oxidoreductase [Synergistaceae bacterium]|jgi:thioredoxin reductase (NADPH)|nr:FAD-dependent oxidoreductase [Synergistaceae bacterium]